MSLSSIRKISVLFLFSKMVSDIPNSETIIFPVKSFALSESRILFRVPIVTVTSALNFRAEGMSQAILKPFA